MSRKKNGRPKGTTNGTATTPGALALRALLHMHRWGVRDLADALEVRERTAAAWFYGTRPSKRLARKLAAAWPAIINVGLWGYE